MQVLAVRNRFLPGSRTRDCRIEYPSRSCVHLLSIIQPDRAQGADPGYLCRALAFFFSICPAEVVEVETQLLSPPTVMYHGCACRSRLPQPMSPWCALYAEIDSAIGCMPCHAPPDWSQRSCRMSASLPPRTGRTTRHQARGGSTRNRASSFRTLGLLRLPVLKKSRLS